MEVVETRHYRLLTYATACILEIRRFACEKGPLFRTALLYGSVAEWFIAAVFKTVGAGPGKLPRGFKSHRFRRSIRPPFGEAFFVVALIRAICRFASTKIIWQCSYIARTLRRPMPRKISDAQTVQFSVTVSVQAIALIEQLITKGLHGNSRAEVARTLIHSRLEQLVADGVVISIDAKDGGASTSK